MKRLLASALAAILAAQPALAASTLAASRARGAVSSPAALAGSLQLGAQAPLELSVSLDVPPASTLGVEAPPSHSAVSEAAAPAAEATSAGAIGASAAPAPERIPNSGTGTGALPRAERERPETALSVLEKTVAAGQARGAVQEASLRTLYEGRRSRDEDSSDAPVAAARRPASLLRAGSLAAAGLLAAAPPLLAADASAAGHPAPVGAAFLVAGAAAALAYLARTVAPPLLRELRTAPPRAAAGRLALANVALLAGVALALLQPTAALAVALAALSALAFHAAPSLQGKLLSAALWSSLGGLGYWAASLAAGGPLALLPAAIGAAAALAVLDGSLLASARRAKKADDAEPRIPRGRWLAASAALALTLLAPSVLLPPPSAATPTVAYVQLAPDPRLAEHLPFGLPGTGELHVRDGYALSYDSWLKVPRWVGYRVSHEGLAGDAVRGDDFRPDPELKPHQSAQLEDYRRSGQQRGHMAPAGSMRHDPKRMSESFLLSNIAPQVRGVNVGLWRSLEARERAWAEARGDVFVMTGPAFLPVDGDKEIRFAVIGNSRVAVPTHFWKIIARRAPDGSLETLAFLVPNHEGLAKDLGRYLVSVRELERVTGLDFFSALPDEQARPLKAEAAGRLWP